MPSRDVLKRHKRTQECAAKLLQYLHQGGDPPKEYHAATIVKGYQLLIFEGFVVRRGTLTLRDKAFRHIEKYGYVIYPT